MLVVSLDAPISGVPAADNLGAWPSLVCRFPVATMPTMTRRRRSTPSSAPNQVDSGYGEYIYAIRPPVTADLARGFRKGLIAICNADGATFRGATLYGAAPLMGQAIWACEMAPHLAELHADKARLRLDVTPLAKVSDDLATTFRQKICRQVFYASVRGNHFPHFQKALMAGLNDPDLMTTQNGARRHPFLSNAVQLTETGVGSIGAIATAEDPANLAQGRASMEAILAYVPKHSTGQHMQRTWWHAVALERGLRQDLETLGRSGFTTKEQAAAFIAGLSIWWGTCTDNVAQYQEGIAYGMLIDPDGTWTVNLWDDFLSLPTPSSRTSKRTAQADDGTKVKPSRVFSWARVQETRLALAAMSATLSAHPPEDPELVEAATAAAFRARQLPRPDFLVGTLLARFMIDWPIASPTFTHQGRVPDSVGERTRYLSRIMPKVEAERRSLLRSSICEARKQGLTLIAHDMREATKTFINGRGEVPGRHTGAFVRSSELPMFQLAVSDYRRS
jgi:hypothetical protein